MSNREKFQDLAIPSARPEQELWRWIYTELRSAILDGRLRPGARLPATRSLATQYSVSRGTIVAAFAQLKAEGYTISQMSAGTFVALDLPGRGQARIHRSASMKPPLRARISDRARELRAGETAALHSTGSIGRAFRSYEPAIDLFPVELWTRVAARVMRHAPRLLYGQGSPSGYLLLRRAIADYLGTSRGVRCVPEQIMVTAGAQQALDLIARCLLNPRDQVWVEDPGYPGAWQALRSAGAMLVPVPVDRDGLDVSQAQRLAARARMAYVTPANQFPLGVAMSVNRRLELLNWASKAGAWIIEDDYDSEYQYGGKPIAALQSLDRADSVIYVGTFTKMLFNALRLGFVVLPESLVETFETMRNAVDRHPPTLDQAILAEFILEGHFGHHVRKMRQIYAERMDILKQASDKHLSGLLDVVNAPAGMKTIGWLPHHKKDGLAARRASIAGIETFALSAFSLGHTHRPGLLLGFAGCSPEELQRGVKVLARSLDTR